MQTLLMALHLFGTPTGKPPAAPVHYKIISRLNTDLDLSAMGQAAMSFALVSTGFFSVTTTDSAGGKAVHMVIDSSEFDGGMMASALPPAFTAPAKGATYDVFVRDGVLQSPLIPSPASIQAAQFIPGVEMILSGIKASKAGMSWSDTTKSDTTIAEASGKASRVTNWTSKAGTAGALQLDGAWTGSTTVGAGPTQLQLQMTGTSQVTANAGQLANDATSKGTGAASMTMAGSAIPLKVTMDVSANRIP